MARSKLLLEAHLKALRLPTFLREIRQTGAAMRRRELGFEELPATTLRAGTARP